MRDMNDMKQTQKPAILSDVGSVASQGLICRGKCPWYDINQIQSPYFPNQLEQRSSGVLNEL